MHEEGKRRHIPAVWVSGDFLPSSEADLALERQGRFDKHSWCKSSCYLSLLACDWPVFLICNPDPILTQTHKLNQRQVGAGLWKENNSHTWSKNTCKILKLWYFCKIHQNIIGHQNKSIQFFLNKSILRWIRTRWRLWVKFVEQIVNHFRRRPCNLKLINTVLQHSSFSKLGTGTRKSLLSAIRVVLHFKHYVISPALLRGIPPEMNE